MPIGSTIRKGTSCRLWKSLCKKTIKQRKETVISREQAIMTNDMKHKILFVCHGNICRSPMAEFVMKHLVEERGLQDQFEIASAATSTEEIGNPVYPPARRKLAEHGINCEGKRARVMTRDDFHYYDHIIVMDNENLQSLKWLFGKDKNHKIRLLMDYTDRPGEVADPWYTGDFEATWRDVLEGCEGLMAKFY